MLKTTSRHDDSDDEEDSFVAIGTPLPVYDKDEVPLRKPVGLHEQTVRDKEGRIRFHGAFTGGFSAGYFNTVGSKEGWAPKSFVSSRAQRAESGANQKPEDYMDEEDFSEYGIAPKIIETKDNFASSERERKRKAALSSSLGDNSIIAGAEAVFANLVLPKKSPVGIRLLRKLGWKEGQGIGPRMRKKKRRKKETANQRMYGCALPPGHGSEESEPDSDDDYPETVTFAPKDVCPISFEPKNNLHGIGYHGLDPRAALGHASRIEPAPISSTGKRGIRGQAFGVGALENDDEDIYCGDSMANYDTVLDDEPATNQNFGWSAPRHSVGTVTQKAIGHTSDVLPGFKRGSAPISTRKTFPPPQLPKDFRPFHRFDVSVVEGTLLSSAAVSGSHRQMDAFSRGALLGETPHLNSVFELVSSEDRAKMEAVKMQAEVNQRQCDKAASAADTLDVTKPLTEPAEVTDTKSTATLSMPSLKPGGFTPFARNPEKQKRYEEYLAAIKNGVPYIPSDGIHTTEWEREREREEFAQAARLYRPLAAMIATRFTRAKYDDDDKVTAPMDNTGVESDRSKAVTMKMFGKLTREQFEWHPDKALCKRFNIANPYPESTIVGLTTLKRDKCSVFNFLSFPDQDDPRTKQPEPKSNTSKADSVSKIIPVNIKPLAILATVDLRPKGPPSVALDSSASTEEVKPPQVTESMKTAEVTLADKEKDERPSMDLFKAIFENSESSSSSSESENDDDGDDDVKATNVSVVNTKPDDVLKSTNDTSQQNDPVHSELQSIFPSADERLLPDNAPSTSGAIPAVADTDNVTAMPSSEELFGPPLPPSSLPDEPVLKKSKSRSSGKHRSHHHRHHDHRGHHHRSKSKHHKKSKRHKSKKDKKKKTKKRTESSECSSSSEADVEDEGSDSDAGGNYSKLDKKLLNRLNSLTSIKRASWMDTT